MSNLRSNMRYMNPYDIHKALINEYVLQRPGDTNVFKRDTSKDKTDRDVLQEHHKFLWDEDTPDTWEAQFAKKYYDKLFKEYCIGDLSCYKENKVALRWRIEQEVVIGKGQFICGNKRCVEKEDLKTWEVNFAYREQEEKKNALVKIRLCRECSLKLNYHSKKREVKRINRRKHKPLLYDKHCKKKKSTTSEEGESPLEKQRETSSSLTQSQSDSEQISSSSLQYSGESAWDHHKPVETKSRDEEMEEYLQDLLL